MTGEKEYLDEIIIRRRRELEKSRHSCIQSGIYAGEELITFSETERFDCTVKVFRPETFTDMPDEIRNVKYSGTNFPSVIKMEEINVFVEAGLYKITITSASHSKKTDQIQESHSYQDSSMTYNELLNKLMEPDGNCILSEGNNRAIGEPSFFVCRPGNPGFK